MRALSVGAVVIHHLFLHDLGWSARAGYVAGLLTGSIGMLGVRVFFVISGYLITTLLLQDLVLSSHVRFGRFYFRRLLRIFPPFYGYAAVVVLGATVLGKREALGATWPAWTYLSDFISTHWYLGHSWSLSVEEQFYLTWPIALHFLGRRRAPWVALAMIALMPLVRLYMTHGYHAPWMGNRFGFDFLAAGCLLAIAPTWVSRFVSTAVGYPWTIATTLAGTYLAELALQGRYQHIAVATEVGVLPTIEMAAMALMLAWCIANPAGRVGRVLNSRPLRVVGIGSYSIYLWQQLFFGDTVVGYSIPLSFVGTAVMAAASYFLVERPSLRVRARLERWWTARQAAPRASDGNGPNDYVLTAAAE